MESVELAAIIGDALQEQKMSSGVVADDTRVHMAFYKREKKLLIHTHLTLTIVGKKTKLNS